MGRDDILRQVDPATARENFMCSQLIKNAKTFYGDKKNRRAFNAWQKKKKEDIINDSSLANP